MPKSERPLGTRLGLRSVWVRRGFLNTLEHAVTRISDALVSLILLWTLNPEIFSKLALAQAAVAPLLLLFVSPEAVMYRDFGAWKAEGYSAIAARVRAYRLFGWGKGQFALLLCLLLAFALPAAHEAHSNGFTRLAALLWAFALVLAPQISGADREFLRLDLKLRELNFLSLYQKLVMLTGSILAVWTGKGSPIAGLAGVAVFSAVSTAWMARRAANRILLSQGADPLILGGKAGWPVGQTLIESFRGFSFWQHLSGVVLNWVQTMDLFFLGVFRFSAREVGLYASVLKLANLSTAVPTALSNTFVIWVGRRGAEREENHGEEYRNLRRLSLFLAAGCFGQSLLLGLFAPMLIRVLSHGRWSEGEQAEMVLWFRWILAGGALFCSALLVGFWLAVRTPIAGLFKTVYLPWGVISAGVYAVSVGSGGILRAAQANVIVSVFYLGLLFHYFRRHIPPLSQLPKPKEG